MTWTKTKDDVVQRHDDDDVPVVGRRRPYIVVVVQQPGRRRRPGRRMRRPGRRMTTSTARPWDDDADVTMSSEDDDDGSAVYVVVRPMTMSWPSGVDGWAVVGSCRPCHPLSSSDGSADDEGLAVGIRQRRWSDRPVTTIVHVVIVRVVHAVDDGRAAIVVQRPGPSSVVEL